MPKNSVFCIVQHRQQADQIVDQLKAASFIDRDISVSFPDMGTSRDFAQEKNTHPPEDMFTGAVMGGIAGNLTSLGMPQLEAKRYEGIVGEGNILILFQSQDSEEINRAKDIFTQSGSLHVCTTGETPKPDAPKHPKDAGQVQRPPPAVIVAAN